MENMNGRTKRQCREEPDRMIGTEGRGKPWGWAFIKYCVYKEDALSPNDLKRYERFLDREKTTGRNGNV